MESVFHLLYEVVKPLRDLGLVPAWIVTALFVGFVLGLLVKGWDLLRGK